MRTEGSHKKELKERKCMYVCRPKQTRFDFKNNYKIHKRIL